MSYAWQLNQDDTHVVKMVCWNGTTMNKTIGEMKQLVANLGFNCALLTKTNYYSDTNAYMVMTNFGNISSDLYLGSHDYLSGTDDETIGYSFPNLNAFTQYQKYILSNDGTSLIQRTGSSYNSFASSVTVGGVTYHRINHQENMDLAPPIYITSYTGNIYIDGILPVSAITSNGGGATHIAKRTGLLSSIGASNLSDILMVSGGGGGGLIIDEDTYNGKDAGGISGSGNNSANQTTGYAFGQGESGEGVSGGGGGLYGGYKGGEEQGCLNSYMFDNIGLKDLEKISDFTIISSNVRSATQDIKENISSYLPSQPSESGDIIYDMHERATEYTKIIDNEYLCIGYGKDIVGSTEYNAFQIINKLTNNKIVNSAYENFVWDPRYFPNFSYKFYLTVVLDIANERGYFVVHSKATGGGSGANGEWLSSIAMITSGTDVIWETFKSYAYSFKSGGAGSGYIGNTLVSNKKMVGYNVPTSSDESTKTESVDEASESPVSGKPKIGNGFAKIKFLKELSWVSFEDIVKNMDLTHIQRAHGTSPQVLSQYFGTDWILVLDEWAQTTRTMWEKIGEHQYHLPSLLPYCEFYNYFPLKQIYRIAGVRAKVKITDSGSTTSTGAFRTYYLEDGVTKKQGQLLYNTRNTSPWGDVDVVVTNNTYQIIEKIFNTPLPCNYLHWFAVSGEYWNEDFQVLVVND